MRRMPGGLTAMVVRVRVRVRMRKLKMSMKKYDQLNMKYDGAHGTNHNIGC